MKHLLEQCIVRYDLFHRNLQCPSFVSSAMSSLTTVSFLFLRLWNSAVRHAKYAQHSSLWQVIEFRWYLAEQGSAEQLHGWTFVCRHLSLLNIFHMDNNPPDFQTLGTPEGRIFSGGSVYPASRPNNSVQQPTIPLSIGLPQCFVTFHSLFGIVRYGRSHEFKNNYEYSRWCIECKFWPDGGSRMCSWLRVTL